jgi:hypothetical protein
MNFATRVRTWRITRLEYILTFLYSEIALPLKPFGIGHEYIYILTDTLTSRNIDLSFWDTLYLRCSRNIVTVIKLVTVRIQQQERRYEKYVHTDFSKKSWSKEKIWDQGVVGNIESKQMLVIACNDTDSQFYQHDNEYMGSIKWRDISRSTDRLLVGQEGLYSEELLVREVTTKDERRKQVSGYQQTILSTKGTAKPYFHWWSNALLIDPAFQLDYPETERVQRILPASGGERHLPV